MNKYIVIPIFSVFVSQIIKFIIESIKYKELCFYRLFNGAGGMPSTHGSFVSCLSMLIYLDFGINSIYFAISFIFSLIVIYDSIGVRYEVEKHSKIINEFNNKFKFNIPLLNENVGHNLFEIICGISVGMVIAFFTNQILI